MTTLPKLSIITVNFNKGEFIEETILSVLNQNYPNLEYIIIDGASTDNSVEIINKYKDKLAFFISEPDHGMTDALQKGFAQATGEIYAYINSDDTYLPGTFKIIAEIFKKKAFDFLHADCIEIDINSKPVKRLRTYFTNADAQALGIVPLHQPSCFWSASIHHKTGGFNQDFKVTMDGDFFQRVLAATKNVLRINKPLATFRIHPGQSGSWAPQGRYLEERNYLGLRATKHPVYRIQNGLLFKSFALMLRMLRIR